MQGKERLQGQNCSSHNSSQANTARSPTLCSVSHYWIFRKFNCLLLAVLANFGFSKNIKKISKYHHMEPNFPRHGDFRKSKTLV